MAVAWDETQPSALAQQLALARIRHGRRVGYLTDGFALEGLARGVLRGLSERSVISGRAGTLEFLGTEQLDGLEVTEDLPVTWLSAEQSNSSLILGNLAMVKLIRHIFPGIHPEVEMTRYLTEVGYQNTAQLLGEVARTSPDGTRYTMIIVQKAIRNQGDAWTWMLSGMRRAMDDIIGNNLEGEAADEHFKPLINFAATIGKRLGELHVALAQPTDQEAFKPVLATAEDAHSWSEAVRGQISVSLAMLEKMIGELKEGSASEARVLLERQGELLNLTASFASAAEGTLMTRNHGDFHLGQILVAESDAFIIDFEGEPARDLSERRAKTNPLRDVAGLLRSLSYLAASADLDRELVSEVADERHDELVARFTAMAEPAFLNAYFEATAGSSELHIPEEERSRVLDLFLLEKAAYEIAYEVRSRPHWIPLPLAGFSAIASRLLETNS
jgi:maltose alpha-D-glucosyltransferase/alpha-amylase